jgi:hypothetical protein
MITEMAEQNDHVKFKARHGWSEVVRQRLASKLVSHCKLG